jgi:hypothetical protein
MATSHAEVVSTVAACVAAGGATWAAIVAYLLRRSETQREQRWEAAEADRQRTLARIEKRTDWIRDRKIAAVQDLYEALHNLIHVHDTVVAPVYKSSPVGDIEAARNAVSTGIIHLQLQASKAALVASRELIPIIQDSLLINGSVFTPWSAAHGTPPIAARRMSAELKAITELSGSLLAHGRASVMDDEKTAQPYKVQQARTLVTCSDASNEALLHEYFVAPLGSGASYIASEEYFDGLRAAHPHWTPGLSIEAVLIDTRDLLHLGIRESLEAERASGLYREIATFVEGGLMSGPAFREGSDGSHIYVFPA